MFPVWLSDRLLAANTRIVPIIIASASIAITVSCYTKFVLGTILEAFSVNSKNVFSGADNVNPMLPVRYAARIIYPSIAVLSIIDRATAAEVMIMPDRIDPTIVSVTADTTFLL